MSIKKSKDLHLSVKQDEKIVLIRFVQPSLPTAELDVLLKEQFLVFPLKVAMNRFFF
jgi:hypothetical protein